MEKIELRCNGIEKGQKCNKKLGLLKQPTELEIEIKCPRCGYLNRISLTIGEIFY